MSPPSLQDGSHGPNDPFGTPNNGSHRPNDLFGAPSNGVFVESHVTDSGFNSKPITNIQNGFAADTKANSKDTTNELNSNPLGGSVDSFGEFEAAFMEQPSKKKVHNHMAFFCSLFLLFLKNMWHMFQYQC